MLSMQLLLFYIGNQPFCLVRALFLTIMIAYYIRPDDRINVWLQQNKFPLQDRREAHGKGSSSSSYSALLGPQVRFMA